jgi:hypothetical protein
MDSSIHTVAERVCAHHAHALEVEYVCDSHCVIFLVASAPHHSLMQCHDKHCIYL